MRDPRSCIEFLGLRDRAEQGDIAHGFCQEVDGAGLDRLDTGRDIAVPGEKDDRPRHRALARQRLLQLEPVQIGHRQIEHRAARQRRIVLLQKFARRRERLGFVTARFQQTRQCAGHAGIVVNDEDRERSLKRHAIALPTDTLVHRPARAESARRLWQLFCYQRLSLNRYFRIVCNMACTGRGCGLRAACRVSYHQPRCTG